MSSDLRKCRDQNRPRESEPPPTSSGKPCAWYRLWQKSKPAPITIAMNEIIKLAESEVFY